MANLKVLCSRAHCGCIPTAARISMPGVKSAEPLFAARGLLQKASGTGGIEDAAGTEAREITGGLLRRASAFLHPVDHLLREIMAHHAVAAHSREQHHTRVRPLGRFALETERIADAVARDAGGETTLLGAVDGSGDVDAESEIRLLDGGHEIRGGRAIVEHGGYPGGGVEA